MSDTISITGLVATTPRHLVTGEGLAITSFRLASTQRKFDRKEQKWVDSDTNWYTVTTFRQLAHNVVGSVVKGQRVVVTGRLRVRQWQTEEKAGTAVEIDAEALGHDLSWGISEFTRPVAEQPDGQSEADELARAIEEGARAARLAGEEDFLGADRSEEPGFGGARPGELVAG